MIVGHLSLVGLTIGDNTTADGATVSAFRAACPRNYRLQTKLNAVTADPYLYFPLSPKFFEKCIRDQLYHYFESNKLLL